MLKRTTHTHIYTTTFILYECNSIYVVVVVVDSTLKIDIFSENYGIAFDNYVQYIFSI